MLIATVLDIFIKKVYHGYLVELLLVGGPVTRMSWLVETVVFMPRNLPLDIEATKHLSYLIPEGIGGKPCWS